VFLPSESNISVPLQEFDAASGLAVGEANTLFDSLPPQCSDALSAHLQAKSTPLEGPASAPQEAASSSSSNRMGHGKDVVRFMFGTAVAALVAF
jgi:hypothetical protein